MIQELKKYFNLKNTTFQFSLLLFALMIASVVDLMIYEINQAMRLHYIIAISTTYIVSFGYWVINFYTKKFSNLNFLHVGITATIVFLLIHPTAPWWVFGLAVGASLVFKSLFRYKGQPIFNPAAMGVYMTYLISLSLVNLGLLRYPAIESWWGGDLLFTFAEKYPIFWIIPMVLFAGLVYYADRFRKLVHGVIYFVTYLILYVLYTVVLKGTELLVPQFIMATFTSSYIFLTFVMVTEPKTSPILKNQQIWLGIVGGSILFLCTNIIPENTQGLGMFSVTSFALLLLNLVTFFVKNKRMFQSQTSSPKISGQSASVATNNLSTNVSASSNEAPGGNLNS